MHPLLILRIIGYFSIGFAVILFAPIIVALIYSENEIIAFFKVQGIAFIVGFIFIFFGYKGKGEIGNRDGFIIVAVFWFGISLLASLPFMLCVHLNVVDALFEAVSGFTTTGSTVISGLDDLPKSFLFYRQLLQWLGGMGLIVLALAILPMLGIGGLQLYKAEVPGPFKEDKITPRLTHTARYLWVFYFAMTIICAFAYYIAGMSLFDAICHSLTTISTGGLSTHDESIGFFHSEAIEIIAIIFMVMGGINFSVHFLVWHKRDLRHYFYNTEVRFFIYIIVISILIISLFLTLDKEYDSFIESLRNATFEVVSVMTSTGFGTVDFSVWSGFVPVLLIFISFIGGCGGSTAGGMKVMRIILLAKQGLKEVKQLIYPNAKIPIWVGKNAISIETMHAVWGFLSVYVLFFVVLMLLMMNSGLDQVSAFGAIATSMNNLGPGLGEVATSFATVSDSGKLIAAFAMLLGRLEIFTILVLLTPEFWRK